MNRSMSARTSVGVMEAVSASYRRSHLGLAIQYSQLPLSVGSGDGRSSAPRRGRRRTAGSTARSSGSPGRWRRRGAGPPDPAPEPPPEAAGIEHQGLTGPLGDDVELERRRETASGDATDQASSTLPAAACSRWRAPSGPSRSARGRAPGRPARGPGGAGRGPWPTRRWPPASRAPGSPGAARGDPPPPAHLGVGGSPAGDLQEHLPLLLGREALATLHPLLHRVPFPGVYHPGREGCQSRPLWCGISRQSKRAEGQTATHNQETRLKVPGQRSGAGRTRTSDRRIMWANGVFKASYSMAAAAIATSLSWQSRKATILPSRTVNTA